ncbi:hypothetical protein RhiJN_23624 [Ceratobasidium sp. AG-Ba]|nr:hypothetical protein RhiJN_23624 [Ceratobasidium sp. AG-Ba]
MAGWFRPGLRFDYHWKFAAAPMAGHIPQEEEANFYYFGLISNPILVARAGTSPYQKLTVPFKDRPAKELRTVGAHPICKVWDEFLAPGLIEILRAFEVDLTSFDCLRIGYVGELYAPVVVWIGVVPGSLNGKPAVEVVSRSLRLVHKHNLMDVDVEIRESSVSDSAGFRLSHPGVIQGTLGYPNEPLTTTLGHSISSLDTPTVEGTGGLFVAESGSSRKFLVTARHVVLPPGYCKNEHYAFDPESQHHNKVAFFGHAALSKYLECNNLLIKDQQATVSRYMANLQKIEGQGDLKANEQRQRLQGGILDKTWVIRELQDLNQSIQDHPNLEDRVQGKVYLAPPIEFDVQPGGYTEDWALIEIDPSKLDAANFIGNAIYLGTCTEMEGFEFPKDGLLMLSGIIPEEEQGNLTATDNDGNPCLMVLKRGSATGLTVGRANNLYSYRRKRLEGSGFRMSKEWPIISDKKGRPFSTEGDSGAVVVDGLGRVGGIITSGSGEPLQRDVTYATPFSFILDRIKAHIPGIHTCDGMLP